MTEQGRPDAGYRGALPPRHDRLAGPWVIAVIAIFVLMFVFALLGVPSSLFPDESAAPSAVPSVPVASVAPSGSPSP